MNPCLILRVEYIGGRDFFHGIFLSNLQLRSAGTHGRSILFPEGNRGYSSVRTGNVLCSRSVLRLLFAASQGIRFLLEQPAGSQAEEHPRLRGLMKHYIQIYSTKIWHGLYGAASPKRQKLWSNCWNLVLSLSIRAGSCAPGQFQELRGEALTTKKRRADGTVAWTGNEKLKSSQYPGSMFVIVPVDLGIL